MKPEVELRKNLVCLDVMKNSQTILYCCIRSYMLPAFINYLYRMVNTFNKPIIPADEELRLKALEYFDILNDLPDRYFSNLAQIIAHTFNSGIALISFVGAEEVYFKGNHGMDGVKRVDRGSSLCSLAILDPGPTIFKDAIKEPCLLSNPLVIGEFGLRFYAGAPVKTSEGFSIGTVCVVGKEPREFTEAEKELLILFAENVMIEIESRIELKNNINQT